MCVKLRTAKVKPGSIFGFKTSKGVSSGIWGLNKGNQYNARSERLDGIWKELKRAVIYVDSFWEGGVEFKKADGGDFAIGVIFNTSKEIINERKFLLTIFLNFILEKKKCFRANSKKTIRYSKLGRIFRA